MMKVSEMLQDRHSRLLSVLVFIVCGSIALPMLPVWQGAVRLLAAVLLLILIPPSATRRMLCVLFVGLGSASLGMWLFNLVKHPFGHIVHALTDIYGQPSDLISDGALLVYDVLCVSGLCLIAVMGTWKRDRLVAIYVCCIMLFWTWSLLAPLSQILIGGDPERLTHMMTGVSGWATWVYWAVVAILLVRDERDIRHILRGAGVGGLLIGFAVAIQWLIGDFSYVLDAPNFTNYFYRVRGTSYYHTSATFGLVLTSGVLLALIRKGRSCTVWIFGFALFLIAMAIINGTRAMSLTLLCGTLMVGLCAVRQKNYLMLVGAVVVGAFISTSILYVKPVSGLTETIGSEQEITLGGEESITLGEEESADLGTVIAANTSRSLLAVSGLKMLPSLSWIGSGVGTLELPLQGNAFNGLQSTYSTHTLYLDILLMAGFPALLSLLAMFGIAAWRVTNNGLITVCDDNSYRAPALLAVLVMFSIGCLFIPQERNELIGMVFLFSALAVLNPGECKVAELTKSHKGRQWALGVIASGVAGWLFLTSPAYVFPVIEFAVRYGHGIEENGERVVVTEPLMKPLLKFFLFMGGVRNPDVSLLQDDVAALPKDKAWLLWCPVRDAAYPELRNSLGYQGFRQGGQSPSLRLQRHWWVMPSAQPVVNILYVGARPNIYVPLQELGKITSVAGAELVASQHDGGPLVYSVSERKAAWRVKVNPELPRPILVCVEPQGAGTKNIRGGGGKISDRSQIENDVTLESDHFFPGMKVALKGSLNTWPNRAYNADIKMFPSGRSGINLADLNYGTATLWDSTIEVSVVFDFKSDTWPPVAVYRMVALNWRDIKLASLYSWSVDGSYDGQVWQNLDRRESVMLTHDPKEPSAFVLPCRGTFRYYRFRFSPSLEDEMVYTGLMELELYPLP